MKKNTEVPPLNAVVQFLLLLIALSAAAFILMLAGAPFWLILLVIVAVYIAVTTVPTFHTVYKSQNLRAIDRFLLRNYRKPIFNYAYNVGHGSEEEIRDSLRNIMDKSKSGDSRHVYGALLGVHSGDGDDVLAQAEKINPGPLRSYYYAYGHALNGDLEEARRIAGGISDDWMKHTIFAVIAKIRNKPDEFRHEAAAAKAASTGIQHYLLYHNFEKMKEGLTHS
ncbi:hypothetical protein ACFFIY_06440 [Bhargavaea ullalensis]|uniref:HEAT repeat-containing protein n=1 Tax=Bhargavaea ullalensis TaxID=1265685 RepID=A0ABV2GBS7_9BACL